jgi:hypothetical protein
VLDEGGEGAEQTVSQIWEDFDVGGLNRGVRDRDSMEKLLQTAKGPVGV